MQHLKNLTLASAKHLLSEGHITPQHHAKIVRSVEAPKRKSPPQPMAFGRLAQQAPLPAPAMPAAPDEA